MFLLLPLAHADDTYWRTRDRLFEEFAVEGSDPGDMIPTSRRVDTTASMKWSDATIQLGWLVGALALEQALLTDRAVLPDYGPGRSAEDAAHDLALALDAVDRLDDFDPSAFPDCAGPWGMDGFFVRDDVPPDITADFPGISTIESDWIDPTLTNKEESQDQVIHLLVGLALVAKWTDPTLAVDGVNLRDQAIAATTRIAGIVAGDGEWLIRNPGCDGRAVDRGENAIFYSSPFASSFVAITGETPAEGQFDDAWQEADTADFVGWQNHNNLHMAMALAATGDAWGDDTFTDLQTLSAVHGWYAYPALHAALWGLPDDPQALHDALGAQLDELGEGEPASPWPYGPSSNGWTTWHRYITDSAGAYTGEEGSEGYRFPGVDYLLARNLYAVLFEADWPSEAADPPTEPGCGCASTSGPPAWGVLAALLFLRRQRSTTIGA